MKPSETAYYSFVLRDNRSTNEKYTLIRTLLAKIKSLLETGFSVTQRYRIQILRRLIFITFDCRELYYQNSNCVRKSRMIESALVVISRILEVGLWELGIFNTAKGLVHGDLKLICEDGEVINCNVPGGAIISRINANNMVMMIFISGTVIPQNIDNIVRFETTAEIVVVVEKDTIFQKLLDENFRKHMPISFILITVNYGL